MCTCMFVISKCHTICIYVVVLLLFFRESRVNLDWLVNKLYPQDLVSADRPRFTFLKRGEGAVNPVETKSESDVERQSLKDRPFTSEDSFDAPVPLGLHESLSFNIAFDPLSSSAATTAYGSSMSSFRSSHLSESRFSDPKFSFSSGGKVELPIPKEPVSSESSPSRGTGNSARQRKQIRERAEMRRQHQNASMSSDSDLESKSTSPGSHRLPPILAASEFHNVIAQDPMALSYSLDVLQKAKLLAKESAEREHDDDEDKGSIPSYGGMPLFLRDKPVP